MSQRKTKPRETKKKIKTRRMVILKYSTSINFWETFAGAARDVVRQEYKRTQRKRHVRDIDIEISRYIPVPIRMGLTYLTYG